MQRENSVNTNNNNKKSSSSTSKDDDGDDEFQVAPEVERSSSGEWDDYEDTSTPSSGTSGGDLELDYADENDARSNTLPTTTTSSTTKTNNGDDGDELGGATSDGASTSTGVWGTAQKPKIEEDDYYPGTGAASMKASPSTATSASATTAAKQKSPAEQYPEADYDADYDTPATTTTTQDSIKQQDEFRGSAAAGEGDEEDNSDVVDSRGWSGEDVGAAADEGFEGDGSFSDGGDVAEKRGEEELEDEEDYGSLLDSRDARGAGGDDDGLEEGEESHYLGRKPDERPLTGGQDWEGDNVAALVNEGEGEEREGIHDDVVVDRNRGGGGSSNSDYYDEEQYREEDDEEEGAEYGKLLSI